MVIDIALKLYKLEKYKTSNCIGVVSENTDILHLLSRIHKEPPISHLFLISFKITEYHNNHSKYHHNVDFVISYNLRNDDNANNHNNPQKRKRDYNQNEMDIKRQKVKNKRIDIIVGEYCLNSNNKQFTLRTRSNATIQDTKLRIKAIINYLRHCPHKNILLYFNGSVLTSTQKIKYYNICDGDKILWSFTGLFLINIESLNNPLLSFSVNIKQSDEIKEVKEKMRKCKKREVKKIIRKYKVKNILLYYNGMELVDDRKVFHFGISNNDKLTMELLDHKNNQQKCLKCDDVKTDDIQSNLNEDKNENEDIDIKKVENINNEDIAEYNDPRKEWRKGSNVEIYSRSKHQWFKGQIMEIMTDKDGEWIKVEYAENSTKHIQRMDKYIRAQNGSSHDNINKQTINNALNIITEQPKLKMPDLEKS